MASFKESFAKARKELGAGKTFTWKGKSYTTDYAEEKSKAAPKPKARPTSPRPKARPTSPRPKARPGSDMLKSKPTASATANVGGGSSAAPARVDISKAKPRVDMPERPISPTRDPQATGRYSKYETARLGNITEAQWDNMTRAQREAKGLPVSWLDYVRSGGDAAVKKPASPPRRARANAQTYSKGGMTKGKK